METAMTRYRQVQLHLACATRHAWLVLVELGKATATALNLR